MTKPNVLSTQEAAEAKGCTRQTIYNALERGDLNGVKAGKLWLILKDAKFEAFEVSEKNRPFPKKDA